jgi:hypothetical protein
VPGKGEGGKVPPVPGRPEGSSFVWDIARERESTACPGERKGRLEEGGLGVRECNSTGCEGKGRREGRAGVSSEVDGGCSLERGGGEWCVDVF